jgi:hypothetical protein
MIPAEERLKEKRERPQERLFRSQTPIKKDLQIATMVFERPDSTSNKVARGLDSKAVGTPCFDDACIPPQAIG